ncbi:MAG TPA: glycogen synthase GlgA [Nitrospirae bacterium]|nr:glycogen synthase GlgA [Nitrospirota bacterium]
MKAVKAMKVLLAASEVVPYAKTGGLADVAGALADALAHMGLDVVLAMPFYRSVAHSFTPIPLGGSVAIPVGKAVEKAEFFFLERESGARVVFIGNKKYFDRDELYATSDGEYADNDERFIFFSKGVLEAARALDFIPDVVHVNDWHSSLIPVYLKTSYRWNFPGTASLLTIHNLGFQGHFPPSSMRQTGLPYEFYTPALMEFYGKVNFLKAGIIFADAVNTVSRQYAREIVTPEMGFGLDDVLLKRGSHLSGITNGIDQEYWDPETDKYLPANYSVGDPEGKRKCRLSLIDAASFENTSAPVAGFVGRLSLQKGLDIMLKALPGLMDEGLRLVVLGRGEEAIQSALVELARSYPKNLFVRLEFDEPFAHLIYAGSDIFLMPSQYEPCGLAQMISMRYGTPPVVRATGGLVDTVVDHAEPGGTGFSFFEYRADSLERCVRRAVRAMDDKAEWAAMKERCMRQDFSWERSASKYADLYRKISGGAPA